MLLCAGYDKKEIKKKFPKVDVSLIEQVDQSRMQKMKRKVPNAIIDAADKKVLKDLLDGSVDGATTKADLIAHRRRKVNLEAAKLMKDKPDMPLSEEKEKRKKLEDRFNFAKPVDVQSKEITDEDNATGTPDQD